MMAAAEQGRGIAEMETETEGMGKVVAPFECEWLVEEGMKFKCAGRGCVVFEALAQNDVTVVFTEEADTKHCRYYTRDYADYAVILGSHRNRRLKIEARGKCVAVAHHVVLCTSLSFQAFWISVHDGLISVGKGTSPPHNLLLHWADSANPPSKVRYVGLSSWDKHVGYRNVKVLPSHSPLPSPSPSPSLQFSNPGTTSSGEESQGGLEEFLEKWELSDIRIMVGCDAKVVPAHKIVLALSTSHIDLSQDTIRLPSVDCEILHALLRYLYSGHTQISVAQLEPLRKLSEELGVESLLDQCEEINNALKGESKGIDYKQDFMHSNLLTFSRNQSSLSPELPVDAQKLKDLLISHEFNDVKIFIDGHGPIVSAHKLILSAWSSPFAKMFTNGMSESTSSEIHLWDIPVEAFLSMLQFMYSGEIDIAEEHDFGTFLLSLILLADQFGIPSLQEKCCKYLFECLSEDSVCSILQIIMSMQACKPLEEACKTYFARHFDYCTASTIDFTILEKTSFMRILQHHDLMVTSEERVLNAILTWGSSGAYNIEDWEGVDKQLKERHVDDVFGQRLLPMTQLLPLVRFPLMPLPLLKKLELSSVCKYIPTMQQLIKEAVEYLESDEMNLLGMQQQSCKSFDANSQSWLGGCIRFHQRPSSFKHLLYICDGDHNGVIYYAGTSYGKHPWMNPVLSKVVHVSASSPLSRYTDAKALISRRYQVCRNIDWQTKEFMIGSISNLGPIEIQPTSFAGPCIENGMKTAWWRVDLGESHQLMCNYYTIRQDGSECYPRSWKLQGSMDGEHWTDLRVHKDDCVICRPGQLASFPIHGAKAYLPFRYFRVALTAPTMCPLNPWNLCICYVELYGYFK